MKNTDLLAKKIEQSLEYLYSLDEKLKPLLSKLTDILISEISTEQLSIKDAFEMWIIIQEQYTNSVMLQTKLKEIIEYRD